MDIKTSTYAGEWMAWDADTYDGPGSAMGWGKSEADAIADLREQMEERQ